MIYCPDLALAPRAHSLLKEFVKRLVVHLRGGFKFRAGNIYAHDAGYVSQAIQIIKELPELRTIPVGPYQLTYKDMP